MSWIADAHRDWHTVHGAPGKSDEVCPLDCWDEPYDYPEDDEGPWHPADDPSFRTSSNF
jgi:hypothetical protein